MPTIAFRILACLTLLVCLGCGSPATRSPASAPSTAEEPSEPDPQNDGATVAEPKDAQDVLLTVKSWDEVQQWIAAQEDKIVVVELWSTWCLPCVREFPKLVKLSRTYPDSLVCFGFNLDYFGAAGETPESLLEPVGEFLRKQGADFPNAVSSDAADDVFQNLRLASIPAVLVYDRDGRLSKRFDNDDDLYGDEGFTYDGHIVPWIEQLLAGPSK